MVFIVVVVVAVVVEVVLGYWLWCSGGDSLFKGGTCNICRSV